MDKTSYALWRWFIPAILYGIFVVVIVGLTENYLYRFLLYFGLRFALWINEFIINSMNNKSTLPKANRGRSIFQKTLNITIKSVILALGLTAFVAAGIFGNGDPVILNDWFITINFGYILVSITLFLLVELVVNILTSV